MYKVEFAIGKYLVNFVYEQNWTLLSYFLVKHSYLCSIMEDPLYKQQAIERSWYVWFVCCPQDRRWTRCLTMRGLDTSSFWAVSWPISLPAWCWTDSRQWRLLAPWRPRHMNSCSRIVSWLVSTWQKYVLTKAPAPGGGHFVSYP